MNIAILSGKGGTGKTLLSVNLSYLAENSVYVDCDVEEPNGLLYYKIDNLEQESVLTKIPVINNDLCDGCRICSDFCKFNALAFIKGKIKVYNDLCHSCGGCKLVCPQKAITEIDNAIGVIKSGQYEDTFVLSGELKVGEESGVPIINRLLEESSKLNKTVFIDSPPGNGCTVMESISNADYCILVAEPSIFGLHNLNMVYNLATVFKKKIGLVINKTTGDPIINNYAKEKGLKILTEIPMDFELGKLNSEGEIVSKIPKYKELFFNILETVFKEVN
ncbi:MAG: ATP-binding protein [Tenericutes bacterium]|nr:ATP-binding protein [Mycoplasmatota bacterium]